MAKAVVAALAALIFLSGCVAEVVEKKKPRKGPVPEVGVVDPGGGELRYSEDGWGFVVGMRRSTALRRMRRICGKLMPRVVDDFSRQDVEVPYAGEDLQANIERGLDHYNVAPYHHIVFECITPEAPLKKPEATAQKAK
jgi:hypothetical protein